MVLHAIRNLFYAIIFAGLATLQPDGAWAYGLIIALSLEFLITLRDFVEEDLTRKLPVTERLLHTVLTANYGAVLALLIPLLWLYGKNPTGLETIWHGAWSMMLLGGAIGVLILGIRDFHAAYRLPRLTTRHPRELTTKATHQKTYLITGGTGFIGRRLITVLQYAGHNIIVLTRHVQTADLPAPVTLITDLTQIHPKTKIDVIVNLAGEPLANGFWTKTKRAEMQTSRIGMTHQIYTLIKRLERQPELLINGSAIGVYGVRPQGVMTEDAPILADGSFAQKLCLDWETEARKMDVLGVRTVLLRTGMVLDRAGGALRQILIPTELGGGATFGKGQNMMSWITRDDLVRLIVFAADTPTIHGALNGVTPTPLTNLEFTQTVARALYRPTWLQIPLVFIKALGGLGREILLADQNIYPAKALEKGFEFLDRDIGTTMNQQLRATRTEIKRETHFRKLEV